MITVDGCLHDPVRYRWAALQQAFGPVQLGGQTFRGIALPPSTHVVEAITRLMPSFAPTLSFLRQSPLGQREPTFVHSDASMGDLTAILYLNPDTPTGDGTAFWRFNATGDDTGPWTEATQAASHDPAQWTHVETVDARFNRLLIFDARRYHSRALLENYGAGHQARLIHVVFGRRASWKTQTTSLED